MQFGKKKLKIDTTKQSTKYKNSEPFDSTLYIICKECIIPFGKHKGATLEEVMDDDPKYFTWLKENNLLGSWGLTKKKQVKKEVESKSSVNGFYATNGEIWIGLREVIVVNPIINNQIPF